jgi:hypothetical protein
VINKSLRDQPDPESGFPYPDTEFNIFRKTVEPKSSGRFKHFF